MKIAMACAAIGNKSVVAEVIKNVRRFIGVSDMKSIGEP